LAENLSPAAFGQDSFDHALFSYSLSMIPGWQQALFATAKTLSAKGLIHVVDFGDLKTLPGKSLLRAWLSLFHVTPRTELLESLESQFGERVTVFPGRYAFRLSMPKGNMGPFPCVFTDTGQE
jgi:S-adenosylmethionine-diacylgycerolhomoserine-N-methlytransferase